MSSQSLLPALKSGVGQLGLSLNQSQFDGLMEYLALLVKWNRAYNLTAVRDPGDMLVRHLLDSLAVVPHLLPHIEAGERILDVGTGPGLPGMILAILYPEADISLLDSNGKKTRFLFQVKSSLNLSRVSIINERVEAYHPAAAYDIITSRAFASLQDMTHWCQHLLAPGGSFKAMKGVYPEAEIAAISTDYQLIDGHRLQVPGLSEERFLISLQPMTRL